jgi:hypothetical protein
VFLPAFFVQAYPSAPPLRKIIPDVHVQHRCRRARRCRSSRR